MIAEDFIARLEKVRKAGDRSWSARCPAHADKGPSLRVTDRDGKILIHCFAGCAPAEIATAAGINLSDLFPPRDAREQANYRRERFTKGTLKDFEHELTISLIILSDLISGRPLKPADIDRAKKAQGLLFKLHRELSQAA